MRQQRFTLTYAEVCVPAFAEQVTPVTLAVKEVVDDTQGRVARHVVGLVVALNGGDAALAARYGDAERRGPVYAAALAALSPERRGEATARLAKDVLGPAAALDEHVRLCFAMHGEEDLAAGVRRIAATARDLLAGKERR